MPGKSDHKNRPPVNDGRRIAKVMARAGLASRREAESWIAAGRVAVNGAVISSPAIRIGPNDTVTVDGKPLPQRERTRLFLFHKPRGLMTTTADPEGRPTIFGALPKNLPRVITIGRLDLNTEGLLLLTNDGITIDGIHYGPIEATLDRVQGSNVWLTFAIREGKNREVRNVLGYLDLQVNRLIRISFGPFQLGKLAQGAVEEVRTAVLREQLGKKIAALADADFEGPRPDREEPNRPREIRPRGPAMPPLERRESRRKHGKPPLDRRGGPRPARPQGRRDKP